MRWKRGALRLLGAGSIGTGALLALGVAYAAWTATGSGAGASGATVALALTTVDASALTSAQLYPGGTGDVLVKLHNPNPFSVTVTSITGNGAITSDKGAACNASTGVTFTGRNDLSAVVGAGATTTVTLANAASMGATSANECQGAVFSIPIAIA
mgnify:CR=1 FL=1